MTEADRFLDEKLKREARDGQNAALPPTVPDAVAGEVAARAGWFTADGRLNRMGYFLRVLCVFPVALVGSALCDSIPALGFPLLVAAIGVNALQVIKRFHDLGQTGWLFLLLVVPVVNVVLGLWLLFGPGKNGNNRFGAQPV